MDRYTFKAAALVFVILVAVPTVLVYTIATWALILQVLGIL